MQLLGYENFIFKNLYENKMVTPGNTAYPDFGWCIIMAGGPGSGKGYNIDNKLLVQGKHFDVDKFKTLFVRLQEKITGQKQYDLNKSEDTARLHGKLKEKGFKNKEREYFFNSLDNQERLPNIIFDITAKDPADIQEIVNFIQKNKTYYKVALVWVAINRSVAIYNNFNPKRGRIVPEDIFHDIHNSVNGNMLNLITTYRDYKIDEFWCIKNSTNSILEMKYNDKDIPTGIPINNVLNISNATSGDIAEIKALIGLFEPNPKKPVIYMSFEEIEKIPRKDQRNFINFYKK